jgi:fucose permease
LETYYDLTYTVVSLIFLSPFLGYSVAALLNNSVHMNVGQRGIAILAPGCRLVTYIIFSFHPPYPALVVAFAVTGFGNGMISLSSYGELQLLTAWAKV